ncbi:MAG: PAS domain S-box protein [Anaerolineae bacterium]|nr:PAS domain S-box protein [Anaerolineae bacterium]
MLPTDERYQAITDATSDSLIIVDKHGVVKFVNHAAEILFDRSKSMLLKSIFGFPVVADETTEIDIVRANGEIRVAEMRVAVIDWDDETAYLATLRDITERLQAQAELQALHNAVSYLFKADSLYNLGHQIVQSVVQEFNHVDCGLLLVDKKQNSLIRLARTGTYQVQTDTPLFLNGTGLIPECIRSGKLVYVANVDNDPRYIPNSPPTRSELVIPLHTVNGVIGVLDLQSTKINAISMRDQRVLSAFAERAAVAIENMRLYEEISRHAVDLEWRVATRTAELLHAKERIEAIFNSTSDAIVIIRSDGTIQQTNSAFTDLFGYTAEESYGMLLATFLDYNGSKLLTDVFLQVMKDGKPRRVEVNGRRKNGSPFSADVALASTIQTELREMNIICSVRDISERKAMEEGLRNALKREQELNELKSRFISTASHEFRTPLATILISADLLFQHRDKMDEAKIGRKFQTIMEQVRYLTSVIDDVLDLARIQAGKMELTPDQTDLDLFCQDMIEDFQGHAGATHDIIYTCKQSLPLLNLDKKLLRQIVNNLLSNAIKYSPQGGHIFVSLEQKSNMVLLHVRDEGIGIPPDDLKHLFEPFHRAANVGTIRGTGLGLSITKQAVELHGGTLAVESQVGNGTTFTVALPSRN